MKKTLQLSLFLVCAAFASYYIFNNWSIAVQPRKRDKLMVVCTTSMITDAVKIVGGHHINVYGLMGPGIDPHTYRARESDVLKLINADLVFYNGLHLEGKMLDIFEQMRNRPHAVAVAHTIPLNRLRAIDDSDLYDPHIWFDVQLWIMVVQHIAQTLIVADAAHAADYMHNATTYCTQLKQLDAYIKKQIKTIQPSQRMLITAHDAFGYFGKAYGLEVIGLQGISTESEPGIKDVQNLAQLIADKKINTIFTESSIPQRNIQAVQNAVAALGWHVNIGPELYSDSLGSPDTQQGTYLGMVRYTVDTIVGSSKQ